MQNGKTYCILNWACEFFVCFLFLSFCFASPNSLLHLTPMKESLKCFMPMLSFPVSTAKTRSSLESVKPLCTHTTSMGTVERQQRLCRGISYFTLLVSFWAVLFCSVFLLCSFNKSLGLSSLMQHQTKQVRRII